MLPSVERAEETARDLGKTPEEVNVHLQSIRKDAADSFARNLLYNIASRGSDAVVRRALAGVGCPSADDELWARLESSREAQKRESQESTVN